MINSGAGGREKYHGIQALNIGGSREQGKEGNGGRSHRAETGEGKYTNGRVCVLINLGLQGGYGIVGGGRKVGRYPVRVIQHSERPQWWPIVCPPFDSLGQR